MAHSEYKDLLAKLGEVRASADSDLFTPQQWLLFCECEGYVKSRAAGEQYDASFKMPKKFHDLALCLLDAKSPHEKPTSRLAYELVSEAWGSGVFASGGLLRRSRA